MNRIWTSKARDSYDLIIFNLLNDWGVEVAQQFIDSVKSILNQLDENPFSFRISNSRLYLRRAKINAFVYLIYQIDGNDIILIDFGFSRSDESIID